MLFRLYIGSNNETGKCETKKAIGIVSAQFAGFTVLKSEGYWKGKSEKSIVIEIETNDKELIMKTAQKLKTVLKQEAIGLSESNGLSFIS